MWHGLRIYCVPIICAFLSIGLHIISNTGILEKLLRFFVLDSKIPTAKTIVLALNYLVFVLPIAVQAVTRGIKANAYDELLRKYGNEQRELIYNILKQGGADINSAEAINIRVFKKRGNNLVLDRNINLCSTEIRDELSFSINKDEGLCVQAFKQKVSVMELEDASKEMYHLTQRQQALAGDLKFIVAVPILPSNSDKVKCVICFDSFSRLTQKQGIEQSVLKKCETIAYTVYSVIK